MFFLFFLRDAMYGFKQQVYPFERVYLTEETKPVPVLPRLQCSGGELAERFLAVLDYTDFFFWYSPVYISLLEEL